MRLWHIVLSCALIAWSARMLARAVAHKKNSRLSQKYQNAKYAFVTGCTGGLGGEIVRQLIEKHGLIVIGSGRNRQKLQGLEEKYGSMFMAFEHDFA